METLWNATLDFFHKAIPSIEYILLFTPIAFLYSFLASSLVGYLKVKKNLRTAYTRKIFHFLIFTCAGLLQIFYGLSAVVIFGIITSLFVLWAVLKNDQSSFYLALARPSDSPKESLFILIPLITTALGGVLANIFFGQFASIGYLVGGWGDAVGEPVGSRFGRHQYSVPSLAGVKATRSIEGSSAVFIASFIVAFIAVLTLEHTTEKALFTALAIAVGSTLTEAFSSHGLDNLTVQLAAAGVAFALIA